MRVAVLSLTRDRLDYTKHCFAALKEMAGCEYDHYVLDQGSTDGTPEWLREYKPYGLILLDHNIGISPAMNRLLDELDGPYDAIVKFDNDCEPVTQNVLHDCARFVIAHPDWLVSPKIEGLVNTPGTLEEHDFDEGRVLKKGQIGGIFLTAHKSVYKDFRFDENNPLWGYDDAQICNGRQNGYLDGHVANHYETTRGQHDRYPEYFERRQAEGGPW